MIQNRFYKTTVGVPFELAIGIAEGDTGAEGTVTNLQTFIDNPVLGAYALFIDNKTNDAIPLGTALTASQLKQKVFFAYINAIVGGKGIVVTTTPVLAGSIKSNLVAYKAPTLQDARVVKASGTIQVTQEICFRIIETTAGNTPMPVYDYNAIIVTDQATALGKIATAANADKENDWFTVTAITNGLQVVSKDANRHFRLAISITPSRSQPIDDTSFAYTVTTPAFAGSGTVSQVKALEFESDVKRGVTTQYPGAGYTASDFGKPVVVSDLAIAAGKTTFDVVALTGSKTEVSPTPLEQHSQQVYYFVVVPAGNGAAINTSFA